MSWYKFVEVLSPFYRSNADVSAKGSVSFERFELVDNIYSRVLSYQTTRSPSPDRRDALARQVKTDPDHDRDQVVSIADSEHPPGVISKNPIDYNPQSPGSISHTPDNTVPSEQTYPARYGSSSLGQEYSSSNYDRSHTPYVPTHYGSSPFGQEYVNYNRSHTPENTVSSDRTTYPTRYGSSPVGQAYLNYERESPPTPSHIRNMGQETTSDKDRFKPTEPEEKGSQVNHSSLSTTKLHSSKTHPMNKKPAAKVHKFFKGASAKQVKTDDLSPDDIIIACVISRSLPLALFI